MTTTRVDVHSSARGDIKVPVLAVTPGPDVGVDVGELFYVLQGVQDPVQVVVRKEVGTHSDAKVPLCG